MSSTNLNLSIVSESRSKSCTWIIYLLIENPFSGALFPCEKDETTLKKDAMWGNLGDPASSTIFFSSNMMVRVSISSLHLDSVLNGRLANSKVFYQYETWRLPWAISFGSFLLLLSASECIWYILHLLRTWSQTLFMVEQVGKIFWSTPSNGLYTSLVKLVTAFKEPLSPFFAGSRKIAFLNIVDSQNFRTIVPRFLLYTGYV